MKSIAPAVIPSTGIRLQLTRLLQLAQTSYGRGWNAATAGNFSVYDGQDTVWISASGQHKGLLQIGDFIPVDVQSCQVRVLQAGKPSAETELHCSIYRLDTSARSVLHAHPVATVAYMDQTRQFYDNEMLKVFGLKTHDASIEVSCLPNTQDMEKLGRDLPQLIEKNLQVFVLKNHGVYAWGATPDEALYRMEALDYLCQLELLRKPWKG